MGSTGRWEGGCGRCGGLAATLFTSPWDFSVCLLRVGARAEAQGLPGGCSVQAVPGYVLPLKAFPSLSPCPWATGTAAQRPRSEAGSPDVPGG